MKNSTFVIAATLIALLQTIPAWAKAGGEGNNTGCNGVGNPNSPCQPATPVTGGNGGKGGNGGQGGSSASDATGVGVGVGVGTGIGTGVGIGGNGVGLGGNGMGGQGGNAQGGQGGSAQGGNAKSYSAMSNDIDSSTRAISFAAPAWTVIPTASGCLVSSSTAWSAFFGLASYSGSRQASDAVCVMVGMAAAAQNNCQYKAAAIVNRRVFEVLNPGASGAFFEEMAHDNLGPVDCALLVKFSR
jgi:hypothetical protein